VSHHACPLLMAKQSWECCWILVAEELLPYIELFTTIVHEQGLVAAATSCFLVCCSCQSCYGWIFFQSDEFISQKWGIQQPKLHIQFSTGQTYVIAAHIGHTYMYFNLRWVEMANNKSTKSANLKYYIKT